HLTGQSYPGELDISKDNIKLIGNGTQNFEEVTITSNKCTLDGILFNVQNHDYFGLVVEGNGNSINNCKFSNIENGIEIMGDSNTVINCKFTNISQVCIHLLLSSEDNIIQQI